MRVKFRLRCPHLIKNCLLQGLEISLIRSRICHRYALILLVALFLMLFVWWNAGDSAGCDGPQIVEQMCQEYNEKYTSGNLCHDLCVSKELRLNSCYSFKNNAKTYRSGSLLFKVASNPNKFWQENRLEEGIQSANFLKQVDSFLKDELGHIDTSPLLNILVKDFDTNRDNKINLGEAQNMWWVLKQPNFINFYFLQDSSAVPHLNGTCGGITLWNYVHLTEGFTLFRRTTPWPLSIFTSNAYRWTLPAWNLRAKVMLSLVELAEELYEKDGVRYHLCNVNGLTLHHLNSYEVIVTEDTMLLSSHQIRNKLSNITCHNTNDCILTPQCQTTCDFSTRQCSDKITRPTISVVCDVLEDYILFDAPKVVRVSLNRLIHRCQSMSVHTQKLDLVHSILVLDIKSILWNYL